ncbi:hypothetical protein CFREI_12470 [Corynebacterium freiburgense]|nr:hypothetical protein CFREI_12470 [Corynebacterium freiburgense]
MLVVSWDLVGRCLVWLAADRSFWALVGKCLVWLGAGWACCHRFHFFGGFYGICDTIGREPVTNSIFFTVFMESATNPRSTVVCNVGCCHKFHFFRRFYGICDTQYENITSSIGLAYQTAGKAAQRLGKPANPPRKPTQTPGKPWISSQPAPKTSPTSPKYQADLTQPTTQQRQIFYNNPAPKQARTKTGLTFRSRFTSSTGQ